MKRVLAFILLIIVISIAAVYIFIPSTLTLSAVQIVKAAPDGIFRKMIENNEWTKWWPGTVQSANNTEADLLYKNRTYTIKAKKVRTIDVFVSSAELQTHSYLQYLPKNQDSLLLVWKAELEAGTNPIERIKTYYKAKALKADLKELLTKIDAHYSQIKNVYDLDIKEIQVTDSILVNTVQPSVGYPSQQMIYGMISKLQNFIKERSAEQVGYPMLNVTTADSINFLVKVAVPVSKRGENEKDIAYKRMMEGGNILVADVKGGQGNIKHAFTQLEHFITDYHRASPAMPFQSLITDRQKESDTAKWVTRIFYPVM